MLPMNINYVIVSTQLFYKQYKYIMNSDSY